MSRAKSKLRRAPIAPAPIAPSADANTADDMIKRPECPVCREPAGWPRVTPCGHLFCDDCWRRLVDGAGGWGLSCPLCRAPMTNAQAVNAPTVHALKSEHAVAPPSAHAPPPRVVADTYAEDTVRRLDDLDTFMQAVANEGVLCSKLMIATVKCMLIMSFMMACMGLANWKCQQGWGHFVCRVH